jgi:hypothetical protein
MLIRETKFSYGRNYGQYGGGWSQALVGECTGNGNNGQNQRAPDNDFKATRIIRN